LRSGRAPQITALEPAGGEHPHGLAPPRPSEYGRALGMDFGSTTRDSAGLAGLWSSWPSRRRWSCLVFLPASRRPSPSKC